MGQGQPQGESWKDQILIGALEWGSGLGSTPGSLTDLLDVLGPQSPHPPFGYLDCKVFGAGTISHNVSVQRLAKQGPEPESQGAPFKRPALKSSALMSALK